MVNTGKQYDKSSLQLKLKNNNETIKRKIDKKLYANNKNVSFEYEFDVDNKYVGSNDKFENKNVCDENIDVERKYFNEKGEVFTIKNEIIKNFFMLSL